MDKDSKRVKMLKCFIEIHVLRAVSYTHLDVYKRQALAIALIRGIKTQDVSYIQIHPTALYSNKPGRRFLISESVRGEGAVLLNKAGERFTDELKPRDVVSAAIHRQMEKDGMDHVYLSVTHLNKEMVPRRLPNIYKKCLEEGYDLTKEPIPVTPAQHYYMGGILSGGEGQTSLTGLYAVGEAGCNGVHGRNRLASNSLLESLVFSKRAALQIGARLNGWKAVLMKPDLKRYEDQAALKSRYKQVIFDEIRRKDEAFYDQWCNDEEDVYKRQVRCCACPPGRSTSWRCTAC